ncbi:MAG TPA: chloride channel protein [Steroidobacteraceae bacterium]
MPIIGGLGVVFLVATFAPEARGHGVPEVMDAIFYREGKIRPVVAAVKSLASALSIGTGAAVGWEGPIIQIGASLGSTAGQLIRQRPGNASRLSQRVRARGIASTFNTPLGGVMLAVELMMPEVSVRTFSPVALATGTATFIGRYFLGVLPALQLPANLLLAAAPSSLNAMLLRALLGAVCGVAATAFIRALHTSERLFERLRNAYLRHVAGMSIVGLMMYAFLLNSGHYRIDGVGYSTIQDILVGGLAAGPFLALLFASKLTATSLSLGSGSSGGIFSPSLFMGATVGGAFGALAHALLGFPDITAPAFAMIGMSATVGGGTGAAMTAITMMFEMTRDYELVVRMIVAVAVSMGVRRLLSHENIYTIKLCGLT